MVIGMIMVIMMVMVIMFITSTDIRWFGSDRWYLTELIAICSVPSANRLKRLSNSLLNAHVVYIVYLQSGIVKL